MSSQLLSPAKDLTDARWTLLTTVWHLLRSPTDPAFETNAHSQPLPVVLVLVLPPMARPQPRLIAGVTTVWLFLAVVLFLYWNDIDAVPDDWSTILGGGKGVSSSSSSSSSSLNGTWVDGVRIPGLDGKITGEEKKEYARNLIKLNETLRERFPYQ